MASKLSKSSSVAEHSNKATPKVVNKLTRIAPKSDAPADPSSPLKNPRLSVNRSQRSQLNLKPNPVDRRSAKGSTPPVTRVLRGSEPQAQLSLVQEDLKNAKEKLVLTEKEKAQVVEDLKDAQKSADKANGELTGAQVAQKRAEEKSEIEKFRAVEMEQAAIESTQKKKAEWGKELEVVQNQHALDVAALLLATEELQRVKQELTINLDAKNKVNNLAVVQAQQVESLSAEVARLKALLDSKPDNEANDSTLLVSQLDLEKETLKQKLEKAKEHEQKLVEMEARLEQLDVELEAAKLAELYACESMEELQKKVKNLETRDGESTRLVSEFDLEIHTLKQDLEKAKGYEQKLVENEACIEKLYVELEGAELAKSYAHKSMEEWQKKAKDLEARATQSNWLEKSASESMESVMKKLEGNKTEISFLIEKVGLLEISVAQQRGDLDKSERQLSIAKEKTAEITKKAESLGYALENVVEEKNQALNNEKLAAESVQALLEEKNKLINELENLRDEGQISKKVMESLAKEKISSSQTELENYEDQIEHLRLILNATNEKYKSMLDEAKYEYDILTDTIEQNKQGYQNSRTEWEQKELQIMDCTKKSEDENSLLRKEITKLMNLLKEAEDEAGATKEGGARLMISLREAEIEEVYLKDVIGETKAESMRLKEILLDKENELQSVIEDNEALLTREAASIEKIEELRKLLDEALTQKQEVINRELSENEEDWDMPPKVVECYEQNGRGREEEKPKVDLPPRRHEQLVEENIKLDNGNMSNDDLNVDEVEVKNMDGNQKYYGNKKSKEETNEVDVKKWEILEIGEKELPRDKEQKQEYIEEDLDTKVDGSENFDQVNGSRSTEMVDKSGTSPSKQHQKKRKPLLQKFGSLLKKKGTINQKTPVREIVQ